MAVCMDKELNIVLGKNYRIKENIKEKNLKVLPFISERTKNKKDCDLNSILLNVGSDLLGNSDVLINYRTTCRLWNHVVKIVCW